MMKSYVTCVLLFISVQIQSQAVVVEGYVKDFMDVGLKNKSVFFCDYKLTDQLVNNMPQLSIAIEQGIVREAKTNDQGFYHIEVDPYFNSVFLLSYDNMCFKYTLNYVLENPVIYFNPEPFAILEGAFGAVEENKTVRHKKHIVVNEKGDIIETGKISRIVESNGVVTIKEGDWKQFYDTGALKQSGTYKQGRPDGASILYDQQGEVLLTILYENGRLVSYTESINKTVKKFTVHQLRYRVVIEK